MVAAYGVDGNWNALRPISNPGYTLSPLLVAFAARFGSDTNWNARRPAVATPPPPTPPPTPPPPTTPPPSPPSAPGDLVAQMVAAYGASSNWNGLRPDSNPGYALSPLLVAFVAQHGASSNWNALRPDVGGGVGAGGAGAGPGGGAGAGAGAGGGAGGGLGGAGVGPYVFGTSPTTTIDLRGIADVRQDAPPRVHPEFFSGGELAAASGHPVVAVVIAAIALLYGIFGGGDVKALRGEVRTLRDRLVSIALQVVELATQSAQLDGKVTSIFEKLWRNILGPIINWIGSKVTDIAGRLRKLLAPLLRHLELIKNFIREIYKKWLRPILDAIDAVRAVLRLLELFHVKFAQTLDDALGKLERQLLQPFQFVLRQINKIEDVIDRIVTLDGLLQRITLLGSLAKHNGAILGLWWGSQTKGLSAADAAAAAAKDYPAVENGELVFELTEYLQGNGGHLAAVVEELVPVAREAMNARPSAPA